MPIRTLAIGLGLLATGTLAAQSQTITDGNRVVYFLAIFPGDEIRIPVQPMTPIRFSPLFFKTEAACLTRANVEAISSDPSPRYMCVKGLIGPKDPNGKRLVE